MAPIDLRKSCIDCFSQVAEDVKDALVYMDAGAGEALHFIGGLAALLPLSPRAVCSLENASPFDAAVQCTLASKEPIQKVLVITASLLSDAHRYILRCLRLHRSMKLCTILTSISQEAHSAHPGTPLGPDAFHDYKRLLLEDFQALLHKGKLEQATEAEIENNLSLRDNIDTEDRHGLHIDVGQREEESEGSVERSGKGNIAETEEEVLNVGLIIEVKHFPMIFCPLTSTAFVFPSGGALAQAPLSDEIHKGIGPGLPGIDAGVVIGDDDNIPIGGTLLAHFLQHLAGQLDLKLDIFTLGPLSHYVGKILTQFSGVTDVSGRTRRSAGILLIDRTLDLITPSCHGDSLMDRIFASFPRSSGNDFQKMPSGANSVSVRRRPLDVRVPGEPITGLAKNLREDNVLAWLLLSNFKNEGDLQVVTSEKQTDFCKAEYDADCKDIGGTLATLCTMGGSLFDVFEAHETGCLDLIFENRTKESVLTLRKWLYEALRREKINPRGRSRLGAVTAEEMHSLWKQLSQSLGSTMRNANVIQIAKSAELALGSIYGPKWEALSSAEKILTLSVGDSSQSVAFQICDLVQKSVQAQDNMIPVSGQSQGLSLLSLKDALTFAIAGYALAGDSFGSSVSGPFSWEEERDLKEAVVDAILRGACEANLGFLDGLMDSLAVYRQTQESGSTRQRINSGHELELEDDEQDAGVNFDEGWEAWDDDSGQGGIEVGDGAAGGRGYGEMQLQLELRDRVEEVFRRLHRVSQARRNVPVKDKRLPSEENTGFGGSSRMQKSLIHKILSLIFAKIDIPGLEHHSSAMGRFFKSGLGRFGLGQGKPKLSDNKVILVFVIGGINGVEVCEAKEAQATYQMADEVDLLLGGTTFLAPSDIYDLMLGSSSSL